MTECSVCCEKINVSNHKKVTCPFCDFNSCRTCVQTYLLTLSSDPHCMGCKNLWSREVIDGACTKVFRDTKLKKHRETILFEREKCLLPQAQEAASRVIQARNVDKNMKEIQEQIIGLNRQIIALANHKNVLLYGNPRNPEPAEKREFVRKCPVEECRGFLSTRWKCQICENNICPDCNEIKEDGTHACDPNNVETVALLKKDTKPCPKCGTMIFKISGCSQMWCPDCHTAFDWNTMRIETGRIHNPHYYEFQRTGKMAGREHGDIPCGGMPSIQEILNFYNIRVDRYSNRMTAKDAMANPAIDELLRIHRLVSHIQNYELQFRQEPGMNNQTLRVQYLLHEISEEQMKVVLQKNEKAREKLRDRNNLIRMFADVVGDLFRQLILKTISQQECLDNILSLREYTRNAFSIIHKRYSCSTDWISDNWEFTRNQYHPQKKSVDE
jgi:hypothetical protein